MSLMTAEEVYEQVVKSLPEEEQRRLVEKISDSLTAVTSAAKPSDSLDWMALRGVAPNLLEGEDAQAWVSRTRREADERRTGGV